MYSISAVEYYSPTQYKSKLVRTLVPSGATLSTTQTLASNPHVQMRTIVPLSPSPSQFTPE